MKPILVLAALLCAGSPVAAQSTKVYTNADLTSRPVTWTRTVTAAELAGLQARQFVAPLPPGPSVFVLDASERLAPMPPSYYGSPSNYADDLWRDPVTAYAVQHPIEAAYGFRHAFGSTVSQTSQTGSRGGTGRTPSAAPTPTVTATAASAGRRVR
jgi:hypothetical protein